MSTSMVVVEPSKYVKTIHLLSNGYTDLLSKRSLLLRTWDIRISRSMRSASRGYHISQSLARVPIVSETLADGIKSSGWSIENSRRALYKCACLLANTRSKARVFIERKLKHVRKLSSHDTHADRDILIHTRCTPFNA